MPTCELADVGPVVVKIYTRGGLMGRCNRHRYLRWGPTRSEQEFAWLEQVRKLGIRAPEPVAAVHRGGLFYRCWLVTHRVYGALPLTQFGRQQPEDLAAVMAACGRQIDRLIQNRILHPDLHPGNVLVDPHGKIWIIDFDKAAVYRGRRQNLADRYRRRWRRAVRKHALPHELAALATSAQTCRRNEHVNDAG
jgi:3-deoxy-D-manno-octulosonic acid kinase